MYTGDNSAHLRLVSLLRSLQQHNVQTRPLTPNFDQIGQYICGGGEWGHQCVLCPFIVPVFTKLAITQQIFVGTTSAEFLPNRTRNVENSDKISFTPLDKVQFSPHLFSLHYYFLYDVYGHFLCRISPQIGHEISVD